MKKKTDRPIIYYMAVVTIGDSQRQFFIKARSELMSIGDLKTKIKQKTGTGDPIDVKLLFNSDAKTYRAASEKEKI